MVEKEYLPIGSVVKLKKAQRLFMITGLMQYAKDNPSVIFDYLAIPYPEGDIGDKYHFTFNNTDIDELVYRGYENENKEEFMKLLNKIRESIGGQNK